MSDYAGLLKGVMDAIVSGEAGGVPQLLKDKPDFTAAAQLGVYIDGYRLRLREALEGTYPALLYHLGKPAFTALADGFIAAQPSRHFNLDKYTIAFGDYVAQTSGDAFTRELATLESAIHDVYQREETAAMSVAWVQSLTPGTLAHAHFLPRAASALLAFTYPVDDYFTALRDARAPAKPAPRKTWLIVLRHKHQVTRIALAEAEHALLSLLASGLSFAEALDDARMLPYHEQADFAASLQGWLARWVNEGFMRSMA